MHCAYPLIGLLTAWRAAGYRTLPLHVAYTLAMFAASVYFDHHWIIDGLLGWAVAVVAVIAARNLLERWPSLGTDRSGRGRRGPGRRPSARPRQRKPACCRQGSSIRGAGCRSTEGAVTVAQGLGVGDALGFFGPEAFGQIGLESPHFSGQQPKQLKYRVF